MKMLRFLLAGSTGLAGLASAAMTVEGLRCEYALDPIGIATLQPRLSWTLRDTVRGQRQTAYQIRVAGAPADLDTASALLWDSGRVSSEQNTQVVYAGRELQAGARCYWQVRAWDRTGVATPWSAPALWQVALLHPADWQARWIGLADADTPAWGDITLAADVTLQQGAAGLLFRMRDSANGYMWQLNAALGPGLLLRPHVLKNGTWSMLAPVALRRFIPAADDYKPHHVEIATRGALIRTWIDGRLVDERSDATFAAGTIGFRADSQESALIANLAVRDTNGKILLAEPFSRAPSAFPKAHIEKGQLRLANATLLYRPPLPKDCPRLRKTFVLDKPVRRATASVCGLGFYELYLNGTKVGDRVLAPPNTPYGQRLLFDTLDVTAAVHPGDNAIGLWLAPGYSDDYSQWGWKWEDGKRAILQLDVLYADGTTAVIGTDASWRAGPSPLTFASLYDGEIFDAGREQPGWCTPAFAAAGWQPVRVLEASPAAFAPNTMPPVRVVETLRPVSVSEPKPGVFVFDLGQNFAGWVRLRAAGPRGTRIVLRHSELLGPDGMLDPWTNRRAKATDTFVLQGEGTETYEPRFTYHGFRYVEVTGYPGRPTPDDITGCVVHADVPPAGTFVCSDALINRIQSNCLWSLRSNLMSIPTDCCMRDERTPCQMDSLAYEDAALCHFDLARFYGKWLDDIAGGRGNPDWNGDAVFLPWRLYREYGDLRLLATQYPNMRALAEHLHARTPEHIYTGGFGDWCPPNDGTWAGYHGDVTEVNTCLYAALVRIVADTAAVLGQSADAARFARLADEIARAFNAQRFDAARAAYGAGSQTSALLPLALDLVPPDRRAAVGAQLVATVRGRDRGHLATGIFGTRYLLDVLSDLGEADLALSMLTQPDYPGFGDQIAHGATTLWEQWTFKGGMNSHNHAMFAGVSAAFFTRLAGITPLQPGYTQIGIRPVLPARLTYAEAARATIRGRVAVRWQREGRQIVLDVTVPVNATARVAVPAETPDAVTESGRPAGQSAGVTYVGLEDGRPLYTLGAGTYRFVSRASR